LVSRQKFHRILSVLYTRSLVCGTGDDATAPVTEQTFPDFVECLERSSLMGFSDDTVTGKSLEANESLLQLLRSIDRYQSRVWVVGYRL